MDRVYITPAWPLATHLATFAIGWIVTQIYILRLSKRVEFIKLLRPEGERKHLDALADSGTSDGPITYLC